MNIAPTLTPEQHKLRDYVAELARDRGIAPAAALAALRMGHHAPTFDVPDHVSDALAAGTSELAERWGLTVPEVEQVVDLVAPVEPSAAGRLRLLHDLQPMTEPADPKRAGYTRGLRELADFLDHHRDVPLPYLGDVGGRTGQPTLPIYLTAYDDTTNRQKLATIARAMATAGRRVHKHADADHHQPGYYVWCEFGGLALAARADREQVCERVVVGVETVEAEEDACPRCDGPLKPLGHDGTTVCAEAGEAHYAAAPPAKRVTKQDREIVRWECTPLLAGGGEQG